MSKRKIISIVVFVFFAVSVCTAVFFASINPLNDDIKDKNYPSEFFCNVGENRIDFQTDGNCAAYAAAFVLRDLGEQTSGEEVAPEITRTFGFVAPKSVARTLIKHGYTAKAYHGDIDTLRRRLSYGVPIIVFVSIPSDTHYAVVAGYDERYFYLADSLKENKNAADARYNRKLTTEEFEKIWKTKTILSDNIYIVAGKTRVV